MAVKKRATKKTPIKKRTAKEGSSAGPIRRTRPTPRRPKQKQQKPRGWLASCFLYFCLFLIAAAILISARYYFGSFTIRAQLDSLAMRPLDAVRHVSWMPAPATRLLDSVYDTIPSSQGLIVDGGELGRSESPVLAGIPQAKLPVRLLNNTTYINLFNERSLQTMCVAFYIGELTNKNEVRTVEAIHDHRVPSLQADFMKLNEWLPQPIAPVGALTRAFGVKAGDETMLTTNMSPMTEQFAADFWQPVMDMVAVNYPKRFGDIWVYAGPVYQPEHSKLSSGIPLANAFYVIVFDLTESGGLRALSLLIPADSAPGTPIKRYITSINAIEQATGLQFLPEIGFDARDVLENWISPHLW